MLNPAEQAVAEKLLAARRTLMRAVDEEQLSHDAMLARPGDLTRRRWLETLARKAEAEREAEKVDLLVRDSDRLARLLV